jgi:hypothetical protein
MRRFTANILCVAHNQRSSGLDAAAQSAFGVLKDVRRVHTTREGMKPTIWNVRRHNIDGKMLERWFLKTLINVLYTFRDKDIAGAPSERNGGVPDELVQIVFDRRRFGGKSGLYYVGAVGAPIAHEVDRVSFNGVLREVKFANAKTCQLVGGAFLFLGQRFLIWLDENSAPSSLSGLGLGAEDWSDASALHHIRELKFKQGRHLSQRVTFRW